ncbi:MAG: uroporphyrinogen decarboxylase family protein [Candidatus Humimicrobiaceae bacterium]
MNIFKKSKKTITSRQRIQTAFAHKEGDCIPLDLAATGSTGIMGDVYQNLRDYLNLPKKPSQVWDIVQQLVLVDGDIRERINTDAQQVYIKPPSGWSLDMVTNNHDYKFIDEWGIGWRMPIKTGHYFDMYINPLKDVQSIKEIEKYKWPDGSDLARVEGVAEEAKQIYEKTGSAITFGPMCAGIFDMAAWLFGYEQCMINLASDIKLVDAVMEKVTDVKCMFWETVLPIIGAYIDMVMECDDLGGQNGPLINPKIYEKHIKPLHTRLLSTIHKHTDAAIYFHACGSIMEFLPGLIESGIQVLNPVQVSAANMDTKVLKKRFGKDITFWGGGCETQKILWQGTVQEVRDEVKRRIEDLAPGGGFVFSQVHNIQNGVPAKNLMVMWETLAEYGIY